MKPSLYRGIVDKRLERELIRDFKTHAAEFLNHEERTDVDWLFLAQHHGIPTRLLDWTTNPLVALYFACEDYYKVSDGLPVNGKVWALNSWELNATAFDMHSVPSTDGDIFKDYVVPLDDKVSRDIRAELPMAVRPNYLFRRSNAQSGTFTIHGKREQALEKTNFVRKNKSACIDEVVIEGSRKLTILRELYSFGIHRQSLFQSLDSVGERVKFRYGNEYFSKKT